MAKTPKPARNHHWVSQCYLKGFATPVSKTGLLWVYDFARDKSFKTKPRGVAAQNDFNRIDIPGQPIDAVEKAMAGFEAEVDAAIRTTVAAPGYFPNDDAHNVILNFIALLAVRNPVFREVRRDFRERSSKMIMNMVLSSRELFESHVRRAKEAGYIDPDANASYDDAKDFERRQQFRVEVTREEQIREEFDLHDTVLKILGRRPWTVVRSGPGAGNFITCDHPVMLRPSGPSDRNRPLGYGSRGASVLFPLSKLVMLLSDAETPERVMTADQQMVAAFNREAVLAAEPQLYAADDAFVFFDPMTDETKTGAELSAASRPPMDEDSTNDADANDENWDDVEAVHQTADQKPDAEGGT